MKRTGSLEWVGPHFIPPKVFVIAYYCGAAGAASKAEAIVRTLQFLKMPLVMTSFQTLGTILKREDCSELNKEEIAKIICTEIPKGIFDSASFMLPISKLSQYYTRYGINQLNKEYLWALPPLVLD